MWCRVSSSRAWVTSRTIIASDWSFMAARCEFILVRLGLSTGRLYSREVRRLVMSDAEADLRLKASISGLAVTAPSVSVERLLTSGQRRVLLGLTGLLALGLILFTVDTVRAIVGAVTIVYVVCIAHRGYLFVRSSRSDVLEIVTDEEARTIPDESLPTYTVLIAAYREPEVINHLLASIARLEYPVNRLEVLILAEADDSETIEAVRDKDPGRQFALVLVPPAEPRTKPKALNFGLTLARGELVAVYDVEDEPDPLQLRRAAVALQRLGPNVGCVQQNCRTTIPTKTSLRGGSRSNMPCGSHSFFPVSPLCGRRSRWEERRTISDDGPCARWVDGIPTT